MQFVGKLERAGLLVGDFGKMDLLPAAAHPQIEAQADGCRPYLARRAADKAARKADADPHRVHAAPRCLPRRSVPQLAPVRGKALDGIEAVKRRRVLARRPVTRGKADTIEIAAAIRIFQRHVVEEHALRTVGKAADRPRRQQAQHPRGASRPDTVRRLDDLRRAQIAAALAAAAMPHRRCLVRNCHGRITCTDRPADTTGGAVSRTVP